MTQFDEAEDIEYDEISNDYVSVEELQAIIAKHFAEIEAVYGKLVKLVIAYGDWNEAILNKKFGEANTIHGTICVLSDDPLVKAAMERSKE